MLETIVKIEKSKAKHKKYTATVKNKLSKKTRKVNFGDNRYENFKDSTGLNLYKTHGDKKRRTNYFKRHSGVSTKSEAVKKEKAAGIYTPKLLSHMFLWLFALTFF